MVINISCSIGEPVRVNGVEATPAIMSALGDLQAAAEARHAVMTTATGIVGRYEYDLEREIAKEEYKQR